MWNKNEREGKIDQAKGKAKQAVAGATGNPVLREEGKNDEAAGRVQAAVGGVQKKVGDAVERAGKAIRK